MPHNPYTVSKRIRPRQFVVIVVEFLMTRNAEAIAEKSGLSITRTREYLQKIRTRLIEDDELTGWMGGGLNVLPPTDDPVWGEIYDCLFKCAASADDVLREDSYNIELALASSVKEKKHVIRKRTKLTSCGDKCPIGWQDGMLSNKTIDYFYILSHVYGGLNRNHFKTYYFEAVLKANLTILNSKFSSEMNLFDFVKMFLESCKKRKI